MNAKGSPPGHGGDPLELSSYGGVDGSESAPKTAPSQADFLLDAIKALAAEEIRAEAVENITLDLATSGWLSAAALLTHGAGCADAGDYLNAERNCGNAREQLIPAFSIFRQFLEGRGDEAVEIFASEAFR